MSEYSLMRDSINATGRTMFFSLCGWNEWYASVGAAIGNSARIGPDDTNWAGILTNIDVMASLSPYSGEGYNNDPCLLLGADAKGQEAVTEQQSRAQFSMWSVLRAPLLLSQEIANMSASRLETYSNVEVISVARDALGRQGIRLKGGALALAARGLAPAHAAATSSRSGRRLGPAPGLGVDVVVTMQACSSSALAAQTWKFNVSGANYVSNPASSGCFNMNDCSSQVIAYDCVTTGTTCSPPATPFADMQFSPPDAAGTMRSLLFPTQCLTGGSAGAGLTSAPCAAQPSQRFKYDGATLSLNVDGVSLCVTMGDGADATNVWGRPLSAGAWALTYLNVGYAPADVSCGYEDCLAATGWAPDQKLYVRDLWAHADLPQIVAASGLNASQLVPSGGVAMFKLTPVW